MCFYRKPMMWPCATCSWKGDAIMQVSEKSCSADELVLAVLGTIDAAHANAFYDEVVAWHNKKPDLMVVLDVEGVDYITSAGLRALLKLRQGFLLRIENVTSEVMEIFETTKFTRIIEISKKIRTVSLEGCKLVGRGPNMIVALRTIHAATSAGDCNDNSMASLTTVRFSKDSARFVRLEKMEKMEMYAYTGNVSTRHIRAARASRAMWFLPCERLRRIRFTTLPDTNPNRVNVTTYTSSGLP